MNGSLETEGETPALAVMVNRRNPLKEIRMEQLASLLGCPADAHVPVTWAMAGLGGVWKSRPVHAFLYDDQTGTGAFLQRAIQGSKDCWNWEIVREFKDRVHADGRPYPAAEQIAGALARDPYGIAASTLQYIGPALKALPVIGPGTAVPLTRESVVDGTYPLRRGVYIYINRAKDKPVDPKVLEFLRFVLSPEGQALVRSSGDFQPLNANEAEEQLKKLE
jgi:phosphate transport system substrate-binding protein